MKPGDTLDSLYYRFNEYRPADFIGHSLSVSDVVVLNHGGDVHAFYVNDIGFRELPDFFKDIEVREHVTEFTSGLEVEGHVGTWHTIDQTEVSGEKFFLMEHDEYGDSAAGIVVNEEGKLVAEDVWNGFTTDVMDNIDEYLDDRENAENSQEHSAESEKQEEKTINEQESEKTAEPDNDITDEQETVVNDGKEEKTEKTEKAEKADMETKVKEASLFTPVYMHDAVYARENGERDQYFASRRENVACKDAIEKAVNENFDGMYLNSNAAKSVVARFGPERVEYVLATTVQQLDYDGRFSKNNKDWAKSIPTVEDLDTSGDDRRWEYVVTSHPAVLDGFIRLARQDILEQEQTHEQEQSQKQQETADISPKSERTEKLGCLHGQSMANVEETVFSYAQAAIDEMGLTDEVQINAARVYGSRSHEGLYSASSDLDVVLSYTGNISEDDFYNVFHENTFSIAGLPLDINTKLSASGKTG